MTDVFSREKRSAVMACIRSDGNAETEIAMVRIFREYGITGWRRNQDVVGHPDFVFRRLKVAVFVDGCFWHSCPQHGTNPTTNQSYWGKKLARNCARDKQVNQDLRNQGWLVLRVWHHELAQGNRAKLLRRLRKALGT